MVDALASGASTGNGVEVRVLSWAPLIPDKMLKLPINLSIGHFQSPDQSTPPPAINAFLKRTTAVVDLESEGMLAKLF